MKRQPLISVIVCTHDPHPGRLAAALGALRAQTLPATDWETIVVNNASARFPGRDFFASHTPANLSLTEEPHLGLTFARRRGFMVARGVIAVLVDDDNVLARDYLTEALSLAEQHPGVGTFGGKSLPQFELPPQKWQEEFLGLLALRDLGNVPLITTALRPDGAARNSYPLHAPYGGGMAIRRGAWEAWLRATSSDNPISDRRGGELTSGGDNDIVLCALAAGWATAYFPSLQLTHLIPAVRLSPRYLIRLNRSIQKSWMEVLARHDACPWPPLSRPGALLRMGKAWVALRAWQSPANRIRWAGACGHYDGRVATRRPWTPGTGAST